MLSGACGENITNIALERGKYMNHVKVSVIIPFHNGIDYVNETMRMIVNQTLKEIEIICVDDGSKDNSLNILNEYAKKDLRFKIISQENSGAGVARNNGLSRAQGEFIIFLDSDDYFELDMFHTTAKIVPHPLRMSVKKKKDAEGFHNRSASHKYYYETICYLLLTSHCKHLHLSLRFPLFHIVFH